MIKTLLRSLLLSVSVPLISGCSVTPPARADLLYVKASGLGVFVRDGGLTFGFLKDERLYLPDGNDCRLILINNTPVELERMLVMLKEAGTPASHICTAQPPG
ncbi:hypothetical protein F2P44_32685 [Massilia sp. CCM 8695]|uniref:Uncharacterized protein n=1 Tax=Massilia frigida TaxID=2609281 RepID=A0ABX0NEU3_9BURK|nr:hypothetical protein [Massilia frigida]NHZ83985.1 hypothetical protein [Massilia frigida]